MAKTLWWWALGTGVVALALTVPSLWPFIACLVVAKVALTIRNQSSRSQLNQTEKANFQYPKNQSEEQESFNAPEGEPWIKRKAKEKGLEKIKEQEEKEQRIQELIAKAEKIAQTRRQKRSITNSVFSDSAPNPSYYIGPRGGRYRIRFNQKGEPYKDYF